MFSAIRRLFETRKPKIPYPRWQESQDGDGGTYVEIIVADAPDSRIFAYVAVVLMQDLHGEYETKLDGLDEAYWDLRVGDSTIVIHLQHYLGIMLQPAGLSKATEGEKALLERAFEVLSREAKA